MLKELVLISVLYLVYVNSQGLDLPPYKAPLPFFGCQPYDTFDFKYPDNANELRPKDIKVLASMGDSITAGFAMHTKHFYDSLTDIVEYRGDSFSIGSNAMQYALGNYFLNYNQHLVGPSIKTSEPISAAEWHGHHLFPFDKQNNRLNAAQSGAKVQDLPGQVSYIQKELTTTFSDQIDYEKDWKVITILIGANNMCIACHNSTEGTADYYRQQLNETLTQIYTDIPKVFVNLLPMFNISQVYDWVQTSEYCKFMWKTISASECPCMTGKATDADREMVNDAAKSYREVVEQLGKEWANVDPSTMKVVVQPFTSNLKMLNLDMLSQLDCFHPSWISHAALSIGLWNSMFTPVDQKPHNITLGIDFICPDKNSYLQ
eukprot:TRINITY_DN14402_c0_g1_i1.p1 TRINITY_DN14402_c0_g1~~TRINITY_DN14402_c0_g1_i1.p1  ORF type:complete len:375 (-),score=121.76 TRINITY_DN14402_c0_g1_i1:202-1326(-)